MPIFGTKDKAGNPAINMMHEDGAPGIPKGLGVCMTLHDDVIEVKVRIGKIPPVRLGYSQIIEAQSISSEEILQKNKNSLGRAVVGSVLLGELGAVVGGISGVGGKTVVKKKYYYVINYRPSDGGEPKAISFEVVGATIGLDKFNRELRVRSGIVTPAKNTEPVNL